MDMPLDFKNFRTSFKKVFNIDEIAKWFYIAGICVLALLMFLTAADVAGRYLFNSPIKGNPRAL